MELATITLRLSGQTQNTVVKHEVSPPELAIYAWMHGEDCIESLEVTGIDKTRTISQEMNRLQEIFKTKYALKALGTLFPGHAPRLPATFSQVGYAETNERGRKAGEQPIWQEEPTTRTAAGNGGHVLDSIRQAAALRQAEAGESAPVHAHELADQFDNSGDTDGDEGDDDFNDDPLDAEIRMNQGNLPPAAPGGQE